MSLNVFGRWLLLFDLLLPIAVLLFLVPVYPGISSIPVVLWVVIQLLMAPRRQRWAAWPMVFILLLYSRSWWLHEMPHPAAPQDGVLFVSALFAGATVTEQRWARLLRLLLLPLIPLIFQLGSTPLLTDPLVREGRPWTPNYLAGTNQGAYVLGLLFLIAFAWLLKEAQPPYQKLIAAASSALAAVMVWQTGSRAALVTALVAIALIWIKERAHKGKVLRDVMLLVSLGATMLLVKQMVRPSSFGFPGIDVSSDSGRLAIARCYAAIPFSGNNRFLWGVGFDRPEHFCRDPVHGGVAEHAHNLYLQLFANTGSLGLLGLGLVFILILIAWRRTNPLLDPLVCRGGQFSLVYCSIQGLLDVSVLHWPLTLVVSGLLVAIPLAVTCPVVPSREM